MQSILYMKELGNFFLQEIHTCTLPTKLFIDGKKVSTVGKITIYIVLYEELSLTYSANILLGDSTK